MFFIGFKETHVLHTDSPSPTRDTPAALQRILKVFNFVVVVLDSVFSMQYQCYEVFRFGLSRRATVYHLLPVKFSPEILPLYYIPVIVCQPTVAAFLRYRIAHISDYFSYPIGLLCVQCPSNPILLYHFCRVKSLCCKSKGIRPVPVPPCVNGKTRFTLKPFSEFEETVKQKT